MPRTRKKKQLFKPVLIIGLFIFFIFAFSQIIKFIKVRATDNQIVSENSKPGTTEWRFDRSKSADDTSQQIKGYASSTSVNRGESVTFYVTVNPVQTYSMDIYRLGWYGGTGGRLIQHVDQPEGITQPPCPVEPQTGLIECSWSPSYTLPVPSDWTSGIYLVVLKNSQGFYNYMQFVVRDDQHTGGMLFQQTVSTYQAYNNYPSDGINGKSLYSSRSYGENTVGGTKAAVKVSFDRPYSGTGIGLLFEWDIYMIHWLEKMGYDLTYATNIDTHANGAKLLSAKTFLSVGHDEYWSKEMFDNAQAARDAKVNLTFFGGNEIYWQVRFENSTTGNANRVMVCYKDEATDPITDPSLKTVRWQVSPVNRSAQTLTGLQYTSQLASGTPNTPYIVSNSQHWIYTGTGFKDGDAGPLIVGYETDRYHSEVPSPSSQGNSFTILSHSPLVDKDGKSDFAESAIYQAQSGAWVFASGTMSWPWALDKEGWIDARIQKATQNILDTFLTGALPTLPPSPTPTPAVASQSYQNEVLADNPIAYWRMGEAANSSQLLDSSTYARNGTYNSDVIKGVQGALAWNRNTAVSSNGTGQATPPTLPSVIDFTIEGWSHLTDSSWVPPYYNNSLYGTWEQVRLLIRPGQPTTPTLGYFGVFFDKKEYFLQPTVNGIDNMNKWVYWTMARKANTLTVYRNGTEVAKRVDLPATASANINGTLLTSGRYSLKGSADELAVYDYALSPQRIQIHYNAAISPPSPYKQSVLSDTPLAYWRLGESNLSAGMSDSSSHSYNGSYSGALTANVSESSTYDGNTAILSDGTGKATIPLLPPVTDFTIEGWSYLTDPNWGSSSNYNNGFYGKSNIRLSIRPGAPTSSNLGFFGVRLNGVEYAVQPVVKGASNVNVWVHWGIVRKGSMLTVYRNGVQIGQRVDLPPDVQADINGTLFQVGAYTLKGRMDEVAVYDRALSADRLKAHMEAAQ